MFRQHITDNLVAYGDGMTVSDSLFLREMNVWTLSRTIGTGIMYPNSFSSMRNAESHFGLIDSYDGGFARMQGTWNQDLIQPQEFAQQTLPDLLVSGRKDLLGGLAYTDYDVDGTNFWRYHGQSGLRLDLNPRLTVPWRLSDYLYGFGQLGLRETVYDTSGHSIMVTPVGQDGLQYNNGLSLGPLAPGGLKTREMIYGRAGIGTEIEKVYDFQWGRDRKDQKYDRAIRDLCVRPAGRSERPAAVRRNRPHGSAQPLHLWLHLAGLREDRRAGAFAGSRGRRRRG